MRKFAVSVALSALCLAVPGLALAASGTALGVKQDAKLETSAETVVLNVGRDIAIGDRVVTDAKGLVQIKFTDQTELVVGPNSALVIEDYLIRNNGTAGSFAVNALSGTFRFVTGSGPKDKYLITTPTGTIGVRGTAFDFDVSPDGTSVLLFEGQVYLCNLAKQCVTLSNYCEVGEATVPQAALLGLTDNVTGQARSRLKALFPYAENQSPLLDQFRLDAARRCLNRPFTSADFNPASINEENPGAYNKNPCDDYGYDDYNSDYTSPTHGHGSCGPD